MSGRGGRELVTAQATCALEARPRRSGMAVGVMPSRNASHPQLPLGQLGCHLLHATCQLGLSLVPDPPSGLVGRLEQPPREASASCHQRGPLSAHRVTCAWGTASLLVLGGQSAWCDRSGLQEGKGRAQWEERAGEREKTEVQEGDSAQKGTGVLGRERWRRNRTEEKKELSVTDLGESWRK